MKRAIVLIVMIFAFLVVNLNAQPFHGKGDMGRKGNPFFMMEKLNLTDAQKDQIKDMHFANEKAEIEIEANLKLARLEMKEAMTADNIDKNRVLSLHDKINNLSGQIKEGKLKIMLEINDLLDENQKKLWKEHMLQKGRHQMAQKKNWSPKNERGKDFGRRDR